MPLVNADYAHLEWDAAVFLSNDKKGHEELHANFDIHSDNQARLGLPSRLVAKVFLFRILFGGSAASYANDPSFTHVSRSKVFWDERIDTFYAKYSGLRRWHESLITDVANGKGLYTIPSGRIFRFEREKVGGELVWPRTKILNYPVQGLGADIMSVARQVACKRVYKVCSRSLFVATVHDSLLFDCHRDEVNTTADIIYKVWDDLPNLLDRAFGITYTLPCRVEVGSGPDWGNLTTCERT